MTQPVLTKIICSISDRNAGNEFLTDLFNSGTKILRLNTAHQSVESTKEVIDNIRKVSERISIMLDTKGAEMRTANVAEPVTVAKDGMIKIVNSLSETQPDTPEFQINYSNFVKDVPIDSMVLVNDGSIRLRVIEKTKSYLLCRAEQGGTIGDKRSVNVPDVHINLPAINVRDDDYIRLAADENVEYIAHSFVRSKQDVEAVRNRIQHYGGNSQLIAKIENYEGINNLDEIISAADAIMIARGDLGVEVPFEKVAKIQKHIINQCRINEKPVILATHLLESMRENIRPTQAEVSDIANAVFDGIDALTLTGETAAGAHPVEAAQTLVRIVQYNEKLHPLLPVDSNPPLSEQNIYECRKAMEAANYRLAKAIVISSKEENTIRYLSTFRSRVPLIVVCSSQKESKRFALYYSVTPIVLEHENALSDLFKQWDFTESDHIIYLTPRDNHLHSELLNLREVCQHLKK